VVPQVSSMLASFKWCHIVISFPSVSSQCCVNKVKRNIPQRYAMIKRLQVISTSGNVTKPICLISCPLRNLLAWYALSFLAWQVCSCALIFSHYLFEHKLRGSLVCIMLVSWACDPPQLLTQVVSSLISYIWIMVHATFSLVFNISFWAMFARTC
jgi:hypothetical protein